MAAAAPPKQAPAVAHSVAAARATGDIASDMTRYERQEQTMDDEQILTTAQRADLAAANGIADAAGMSDADLLTQFAERIDMSGELAVDPDGVLELESDDVLVALQTVPDEDRELADNPDLLHLSILLRPESDAERAKLEAAELLDAGEGRHGENDEWIHAWWGSLCTVLPRDASITQQLEALNRVMDEAQRVLERGSVGDFFERLEGIRHDDDLEDEIEVEVFLDDDDGPARN
jgi:hypothetical protein